MIDQERKPRGYSDLLALWEAAELWQPAATGSAATGSDPSTSDRSDRPTNQDIDLFADRQIADALQIDILGLRDDDGIEVYSAFLRRTVLVRNHGRMRYSEMLSKFGTPVRKVITKAQEDVPGMYSVGAVRDMLGHLSSIRVIGDETKRGFGCWPNGTSDGLVLVNHGEGLHYTESEVTLIDHPRYGGLLLDFSSGAKPWYEHDNLTDLLRQAESKEWRSKVADELVDLFRRWNWRGKHDPLITTALVFATWIQTVWSWRPRIDVLGASGTGKSILCEALMGLYRDMTISTNDTSAAGLRQQMRKSARVVIVDEVDTKNRREAQKQREILKMLRAASRSSGAVAIRGTPSGDAATFTLQHLCWLAGISLPYEDQADRNRAVILNLLPAAPEAQNKLCLPSAGDLGKLGQRSLAAAIFVARIARERAIGLKDVQVEGADPRQVESYAVPAAMISAVLGMDSDAAAGMLRTMLSDACDDEGIEADEAILVKSILGAHVMLERHKLTVGQVIEHLSGPKLSNREEWLQVLAGAGIRIDGGAVPTIFLQYQQIQAKLLRGSRWEGQEISQYLRRINGARAGRCRVGGVNGRGVRFDLDRFVTAFGEDGSEEQVIPYGDEF